MWHLLFSIAPSFAGMLRISGLHGKMETLVQYHSFVIYGDPAYPRMPLPLKPHRGAVLTPPEVNFNKAMSTVHQAVGWRFGKVVTGFAFADLKKIEFLLQRVPLMYKVATLLANCHKCCTAVKSRNIFMLTHPHCKNTCNHLFCFCCRLEMFRTIVLKGSFPLWSGREEYWHLVV